jgi:hypothetical protein
MAKAGSIQVVVLVGVLSLGFDVRAQDTSPAQHGMPIPGSWSTINPATQPHNTSEAIKSLSDPNLSDLERMDALLRYRAMTGEDKRPNCFFGPVERRISGERLVVMFQQFADIPGNEAWALLMAEPEDPNATPIKVAIPDKNGPNCPDGDVNAKLLEERQRLLDKQWQTQAVESHAARPTEANPATGASADPSGRTEVPPTPVSVLWYGDVTPLQRVGGLIRSRASWHLDQSPDCFYGPVDLRIPSARLEVLVEQFRFHSGEEDWALLQKEPQDPTAPRLTYIVRSGRKPDCPAGDIDARLRSERQRLLDE